MPIVLIFDCGATNTRTIALDEKGKILAAHHIASATKTGAESADYHIWDFEEICDKLFECARHVVVELTHHHYDIQDIIGISVTTFGVDGAPFDRDGKPIGRRHKRPGIKADLTDLSFNPAMNPDNGFNAWIFQDPSFDHVASAP